MIDAAAVSRVITAVSWPWLTTDLVFARLRLARAKRTSSAARAVVAVLREHGYTRMSQHRSFGKVERRYHRDTSVTPPPTLTDDVVQAWAIARTRLHDTLEPRRSEHDTMLLVRALEHASDCGDPDCTRCEEIRDTLEEPEMWATRRAIRAIERLEEIESVARELVSALDGNTVSRPELLVRAVAELRAII